MPINNAVQMMQIKLLFHLQHLHLIRMIFEL